MSDEGGGKTYSFIKPKVSRLVKIKEILRGIKNDLFIIQRSSLIIQMWVGVKRNG
jgi:hypothetical protein